jgi:predicted helicase
VTYRPFFRQHAYFDAGLNHIRGQSPRFFPTANHPNFGFVVTGVSSHAPFGLIMVDSLPDLHVLDTGQFFGRWRYEEVKAAPDADSLFVYDDGTNADGGYRRIDNITDAALRTFAAAYGNGITKDDVFYYVYGLLHSFDYREMYAADLKKTLPRTPLVADPRPFIEAGRALSALHLGYETAEPYNLSGLSIAAVGNPYDFYRVAKLAYARKRVDGKFVDDKSAIVCNPRITLSGIPEEAHRYMLGTRSAIDWLIERWQATTDKASRIVNDPNDWSREVGEPRYIIDLVARVVTVSVETMKIVDSLPPLDVLDPQPK